jgi:hypothetical protein
VSIHTKTCTESQQAFHVEAIRFNLNTMGATLSTFADRLKLFPRFNSSCCSESGTPSIEGRPDPPLESAPVETRFPILESQVHAYIIQI